MNYSKIQKFISSFIILLLLCSITFRVPFFGFNTYAGNSDFYNLVSIIVDENTYDEVDSEIEKYAKNIQGVMKNTKVVILPTPKNTSAFKIASLNEALYFEWYKSVADVDFESKLVWTVLIWDFNLPIVFKENKSSKTILPFTDFENKSYIFNHEFNRYEENKSNIEWIKSEIWHWVISPNLWSFNLNIKWLKDYFKKNNDFYNWTWNFKYSDWFLNWDKKTWVPSNYKPFVFYYDQIREEKSLNYTSFRWYKTYLSNKEDIVYNRFSKDLSKKISDDILWASDNITWLINNISEKNKFIPKKERIFDIKESTLKQINKLDKNPINTKNVPDIQTRHITKNLSKNFIEIFAKWVFWEFRLDVKNAWRYTWTGWVINADFIPYFITVLDLINDWIVKEVNDEIENEIDKLVKNWLSRNIAVPMTISKSNSWNYINNNNCSTKYINFLYWTQASDITNASECSIFRWNNNWWWQLVEQNRWYSFDKDKSINDWNFFWVYPACNWNQKWLNWYFWWNTMLNLNINKASNWEIELVSQDYKNAIKPIFDISWWKIISDDSYLNSPKNCFENNFIKTYEKTYSEYEENYSCIDTYKAPINWQSWLGFSCNQVNPKFGFSLRFEDFYKNNPIKIWWSNPRLGINFCSDSITHSDSTIYNISFNKYVDNWDEIDLDCIISSKDTYLFKKISSYIIHKSPTISELKAQIKWNITPNLAIDKNRYIDFISAKWNYKKISYPALFRLKSSNIININLSDIQKKLDKILKTKSDEINSLIDLENPNLLQWKDKELYSILKNSEYPSANFDLVKFIKNKPNKTFKVWSEEKTISYYDTLVFALYWNNLNSISGKYSAIFNNYLSNEFWVNNKKYFLPQNKKQYEISYLWAPWNASNMYIKVDPEQKSNNPYANIISDNLKLNSILYWYNIWKWNYNEEEWLFKCSPPDWVPIWKWIPAVMCWLWELLPPSISLSEWACWPETLFLEEEREEIRQCNWDVDKNWINDCIEKKLIDWKLELSADKLKYFYNKNAILKAEIKDKNWKIVKFANSTDINFEIIKIEAKKDKKKDLDNSNIKVVYNKDWIYNKDKSIISDYVLFKNLKIRSTAWVSNYWASFKTQDSNIYFKAYISVLDNVDKEQIFLESDTLKLQVRWERLFNTSYKLKKIDNELKIDIWNNLLKVSDKQSIFLIDWFRNRLDNIKDNIYSSSQAHEKIVLNLQNISKSWTPLQLSYPLKVQISNQNNLIESFSVSKNNLNLYKALDPIKKSGSYKIEITDNSWFKTEKNIELISDSPYDLEITLWTTILESWWNISSNFITIYDKYKNPVSWEFYDIDFEVDWWWAVFLDNEKDKIKTSTFEWFKVFRLKSTNKTWNNKIKVELSLDWKKLLKKQINFRVLEDIKLIVIPKYDKIKVWWWIYKYQVSLRNKDWTIINDFNSRVYLTVSKNFIQTTKSYSKIINGIAEVEFKTKTLSWKKIPLEFQVEWLNKIIQKQIIIFPEKPMKIDLILNQNKIEASINSSSNLNIELKDRYNNLVFNDNSTITNLEILDIYSNIITSDKLSSKISEWKTKYKINWTVNPWVAYFKISTNPNLKLNSFIIKDDKWNIIVNWVWENSTKIETFYFWNKQKLSWKKYSALYTNLLWSNYWDISQQNYLAWSLLFDKENKALAVTSLLNNSFKYKNSFNLNKSWKLNIISDKNDLSQDIEINTSFINKKLSLNIYNKALNIYIWNIFYNFNNNIKLISCESDINSCLNKQKTSIVLKSISPKYSSYKTDNKLIFRDIYWKILFEILDNWIINRFWSVELVFNKNNNSDYLSINIKTWWQIIWELWFGFKDSDIIISRNENIFNSQITNLKNTILVLLNTNSYWAYNSSNIKDKVFYYNDPFITKDSLNTFSKQNPDSFENFNKKPWVWWKGMNKSLLAFSAWKSVWESVKDYMSFWIINLWDPVIFLKKIKKKLPKTNINRNFDSTIWKLLSNDKNIEWYKILDYDNDNKKDILLIKDDKYLKLLENKDIQWRFLDKWNLANIIDMWNKDLIQTWDFTWDWYDDIFFVNKNWYPFLLNNVSKDFSRYSLKQNFNLWWRIIRAKSFDMDNDNISDIITLDDNWKINIFYWTKNSSINPVFTKLEISNNRWIILNSDIRNDNWLVYFNSLFQPSEYTDQNKILHNELFIKYPFSYENDISKINYDSILKWDEDIPNSQKSSFFIKSEYSEWSWISVEKTFKDKNWWFIVSWDIVEVEIILKNVTRNKLKDIVYVEKIENIFELDTNSIEATQNFKKTEAYLWYNFLLKDFELNSAEELKITYKLKVKPISYSYMEVWLFEKWELWDDKYGDIIVKKDNKNCSEPVDFFRSLWSREYKKDTKIPSCDENKIKLPSEIEKNSIDLNNNQIPDYIDRLTNKNNTQVIKDYSEKELNKLNNDSDNDWIPDNEDYIDWNILWSLFWNSESLSIFDTKLDSAQQLLNWFSCSNSSCFASPLNWAPLAPWGDPVLFGIPIWDWLNIDEWIPILSGLTWINIPTPGWCYQIPVVWPVSPFKFTWSCNYSLWAWWVLWTTSLTNFFRIFVTPTFTWWVGTAMCFWAPAAIVWYSVPPVLSPLIPWWNCIVIAKKLFWCDWDGSSWDVASIGLPRYSWDGSFWFINWNCNKEIEKEKQPKIKKEIVENYFNSTKNQKKSYKFKFLQAIFSENPLNNSLFSNNDWSDISVEVDLFSILDWNFNDVIEIQKNRISSFPSWLMDWVTRQIEEIINKLTDFPTISIILPDFTWIFERWNEELDFDFIKLNKTINNKTINNKIKKINSWIKEAYEYISNTPLVKIEQETVNIILPWISQWELSKKISQWWSILDNWEEEYNIKKEIWENKYNKIEANVGNLSENLEDTTLKEEVKKLKLQDFINVEKTINSLKQNIEILRSYKTIPEDINNLLNKKQEYLEQILCNIEIISNLFWWWIWKNWDRFKAWVKLYILIKSVLKSWQLIVDVFIDYETECSECKNERNDLLDFEFSLIDFIVPKIPIIRFPKWPDLTLDLHNIRAWLTISLPEFDITNKPILLPNPPQLLLPNPPEINLNIDITLFELPALPLLPIITIPTLPDLPSLPNINLPDLPPPPKLPKLLSSLEWILNIIKLITKAMCILKSIPIAPEWRAWDQIAFLTERSWYLSIDFLNTSIPEFSFSFLDEIKVTTYVNLEFETDFLVELARQIALPLNSFSNNMINFFNKSIGDLDYRDVFKWNNKLDINISNEPIDTSIWFYKKINNKKFIKNMSLSLSSTWITSNPKLDLIRNVWNNVENLTFSKENKLIEELKYNSREKFNTITDIINTEIIKNKTLRDKFKDFSKNNTFTKVWFNFENKTKLYNKKLEKYNKKYISSLNNLLDTKSSYKKQELKQMWKDLLSSVNTTFEKYFIQKNEIKKPLLSAVTNNSSIIKNEINSCRKQAKSEQRYNYEWLYIIEWSTSYRLFDYLSELDWDEYVEIIDIDNDSDEDLIYLVNWQLFLKENLKIEDNKNYVSTNPLILDSDNNIFYNSEIFEAINNFSEIWNDTSNINIKFISPTNNILNKYRIWFYYIIDKYLNENNYSYFPDFIKKDIVDVISDRDNITKVWQTQLFIKRKNLVYIKNVWELKWVRLKTKKLINIRDNLSENKIVNILKWTILYAWKDSFTIRYNSKWNSKKKELIVLSKNNIELLSDIIVTSISWNAYIKTLDEQIYEWINIRNYLKKPLFFDSKIEYIWNAYEADKKYIELKYYDNSQLNIDFKKIKSWLLYDLWYKSKNYYVRLSKNNDYFYAKINAFKKNITWTLSNQILLSPQIAADLIAPELQISSIKIPVYQTKIINLSNYIYENSWIANIKEVFIDFDLESDTNNDWNTKNDNDSNLDWEYKNKLEIKKSNWFLKLKFSPFDKIFKKKVWVTLIDKNNNVWYYEIYFEVYTPIPQITEYKNWIISWVIDENLSWEPINLYRFRWWAIKKLKNNYWDIKVYTTDWKYNSTITWSLSWEWLNIKYEWKNIAFINEKTWKITFNDLSLKTKVLSSNNILNKLEFPKIILIKNNSDIYYEYIKLKWVDKVKYVNDFDNLKEKWIYFKFTDFTNYNYYTIPEELEHNPWTLSIYRSSTLIKQDLFTIFNDWRINTLNNNYKLKYSSYKDYIVLELMYLSKKIWEVLFINDSEYIMK